MSKEEASSATTTKHHVASLYDMDDDDEEEDDEEADFNPGDDSDDNHSDNESTGSSNNDDDDDDDEEGDCVILHGKLHLNDEGRLIYHGTWSMKSEYDVNGPGGGAKFKLKSQEVFHSVSALEKMVGTSGGVGDENGAGVLASKAPPLLFDFRRPTLSKLEGDKTDGSTALPSRRTILFDGFFLEKPSSSSAEDRKEGAVTKSPGGNGEHKPSPSQGKRIKERDVEVFFQLLDGNSHHPQQPQQQQQPNDDSISMTYAVTGRGYNAYGPFVLEGAYATGPSGTHDPVLVLRKMYGSGGNAKDTNVSRGAKRKRRGEGDGGGGGGDWEGNNISAQGKAMYTDPGMFGSSKNSKDTSAEKRRRKVESDEDEDDDDDWAEEETDYMELFELTEDAKLSVEALRKKYYGGGGAVNGEKDEEDGGGGKLPAKKSNFDDSDDSECGF